MKTISLCMIVKDEEYIIARCLDSVKDLVDEIIIVDTGSTDNTKSIVKKYTNNIYDFEWVDDFSKARNFSFSKASCDYILWLDADDVILPEDRKKFFNLKQTLDGTVDMYQMKYNYSLDNNGYPTLVQIRARLLRREYGYTWVSPIHEVIIPSGNIQVSDIAITHKKMEVKNPRRNLEIFEKMINNGIELDDRQFYTYAKEYYCLADYSKAKELYKSFIKKYEDNYNNVRSFIYYAILELADCYKKLGYIDKQKDTLFIILKHEIPGSECCCKIADIFLEEKNYTIAKFWYELAIQNSNGINPQLAGDSNVDYNGYYPYINLCVCYFYLGDKNKAFDYNEKAGKLKPNDETYLFNKKIFEDS